MVSSSKRRTGKVLQIQWRQSLDPWWSQSRCRAEARLEQGEEEGKSSYEPCISPSGSSRQDRRRTRRQEENVGSRALHTVEILKEASRGARLQGRGRHHRGRCLSREEGEDITGGSQPGEHRMTVEVPSEVLFSP